ncbi:MAG: TM0106 family RecB-like putative nuclease, partial [Actinomycetales bacterium]
MRKIQDQWVISPQDIIAELECNHRLHLEWSVINKLLPPAEKENSPELELLAEQGQIHESNIAEQFKLSGTFIDIGKPSFTFEALTATHQRTMKAIAGGVETIYQAAFFNGSFMGFADFLVLLKDENGVPIKDAQGRFIYDPIDAKSARSAKRAAVLQVATYAAMMQELNLATPHNVHLWLGGDSKWSAPALDLIDLAQFFMTRVRNRISTFESAPTPTWAPPKESCSRCRWSKQCDLGRHQDKDLSLIQGIRSSTRSLLVANGINTINEMAVATDEQRPKPPREVSKGTFAALREQAAIQVKGEDSPKPIYEIRDVDAFGLMPEGSDGDIWFDMEGDPFANNGAGLEYMFGYLYRIGSQLEFHTFDARDSAEEKVAFIEFIKYVMNRRIEFPDMHVYHYASYEVSAMLRLAQRHVVFEFEVDKLVREGVFVDLYTIVRNAFRFSTESMSIKYIEKVYWDGSRDKVVSNAVGSVVQFEKALAFLRLGNEAEFLKILDEIKSYNKDDVDSTQQLDNWVRAQAIAHGVDIASLRPAAEIKWEATEEIESEDPVSIQLLEGVPEDRADRNIEQLGLSLLSAAISFHHREARPAWWAIFDR